MKVPTKVVEPKVTTKQLAEKYPACSSSTAARSSCRSTSNLKLAKTYGIAVGQVGLETPAGLYHVQNKAVNPAWTCPNSDWVAPAAAARSSPAARPRTR